LERMALANITWDDVQQLADDGNRYEAIDGDLHVTAVPSFGHQRISHRLAVALHDLLERPGLGVLAAAPGVTFPGSSEGVQPDLVFVSEARRGILRPYGIDGAPDLVVEILSPSTRARDTGVKLKLYRRHGVAEYWIVDPEARLVEVWRLGGSESRPLRFESRLPVRLGDRLLGELDLEAIFESD
jgi:Uma2 family endonuclease